MQSLLRYKLLLGATPRSANSADSSRGFWPQAGSPRPGLGAYVQKINKKLQVLDRTKALHGPRTQAYGETKYSKEKTTSFGQNQSLAWSSNSSLWGNYTLEVEVLDKTKALHGPWTKTYGETIH